MDKLVVLSGALFVACFFAVYFYNVSNPGSEYCFEAPYHFKVGEFASIANSYFFVFITSLLFFGFAAPLALAVEGLKYGALFSLHAMPAFDLLFFVPQALACRSAILIGESALEDFAGRGSFYANWRRAFKYFIVSLVLLGVLLVARGFF